MAWPQGECISEFVEFSKFYTRSTFRHEAKWAAAPLISGVLAYSTPNLERNRNWAQLRWSSSTGEREVFKNDVKDKKETTILGILNQTKTLK